MMKYKVDVAEYTVDISVIYNGPIEKNNAYMNKFRMSKKHSHTSVKSKRNLDRIVLLGDKREFDTIVDLRNTALYYGKLMSLYGFDMKSGEWNTKLFSVTKSDKEIEGINSDRLRFNEAVNQYNRYVEYLSRKCHLKVFDKLRKGFIVSFCLPCSTHSYKTNDRQIKNRK